MRNCELCGKPVEGTTGFKGVVICDNCRRYYAHWIYRKTSIGDYVKKEVKKVDVK